MTCPLHPVNRALLRFWVPDSAGRCKHNTTNVSAAEIKAYFTAVFHTFFHCAKKGRVPVEAAILILRVIGSCHRITTSSTLQ